VKNNRSSFIIGRQPVMEALRSGTELERIFMLTNATGELIHEIRKEAQSAQVPVNSVPAMKLNTMSRANHQGVIAVVSLVSYMDLQQVIDHVVASGDLPLFVMLDGITDVRNIGAIARSAVCCGAQALIIPDKGVGALNEEAMKSSAGAMHKISICREASLLKAVDTLHLNGIRVCTAEMRSEKQLHDLDLSIPLCIIMGSEDKGIQPYLMKAADERFTIPMSGRFDSFNVSVAAGIILYECFRQRSSRKG
jgi:23S rRNA (guanosine2251-2'-O)-methyltransferase